MNKAVLDTRWNILKATREFFWNSKFIEVETPLIVAKPGQEPHLTPMELTIHNEAGRAFPTYLHTSPEYAMKKLLAKGYKNIFTICKTFRDFESFGGDHNPEFTMIEWYRNGGTMEEIMDDCEELTQWLVRELEIKNTSFDLVDFFSDWERITMKELWMRELRVNLDEYLAQNSLYNLCNELHIPASAQEPYEDLFYKIFLNNIESKLGQEKPLIVSDYPAPMAALATTTSDGRYANRFEIYIKGVEIANAFQELCDPAPQKQRFLEEQKQRAKMEKRVFPIDEELLDALNTIESAAGIALGLDRLVQVMIGCQNINDVIPFPMSKQFSNEN